MLAKHRDALICDLAETYHILDIKALPVQTLAVLSCGLGKDSRVMREIHGEQCTTAELMTAAMVDRLSLLVYANTKDAQKGRNKPEMLIDKLTKTDKTNSDVVAFNSGEEFKAARERIIKGG